MKFWIEKEVMLTQNYHAVYQFLDDQGTWSSASEESVQICQKEISSMYTCPEKYV
jgi:hypothetical protein